VENGGVLKSFVRATATEKMPIMLTQQFTGTYIPVITPLLLSTLFSLLSLKLTVLESMGTLMGLLAIDTIENDKGV
jgi:hypothetical protein